jgi:hypothetical protein
VSTHHDLDPNSEISKDKELRATVGFVLLIVFGAITFGGILAEAYKAGVQ